MEPTRREFLRQVGVFFATVVVGGVTVSCTPEATPPTPTCYAPIAPTPTPTPEPTMTCYKPTEPPLTPTTLASDARWNALRASWLELNNPQLQSYEDTDFSRGLRQQHRTALTALTEAGQLDAAVADDIQIAFEQAIAHIQRQQFTCYKSSLTLMQAYTPREDVLTQAEALTEMAQRSEINPATVERARAALARDMAWLAQFQAKQQPVDLANIEATPTEIKAARILVDLLATE